MKRLYTLSAVVLCVLSLNAQNCFDEFKYGQIVTVAIHESGNGADSVVVEIPINTKQLVDDGKLDVSGIDLQVTDDECNPLPFYVQDLTERDKNIVYVKVPGFDGEARKIHFYYGKPSASKSMINGNRVFDFFDDFNDTEPDMTKWESIGKTDELVNEDGSMKYTGTYGTGGIFKFVRTAKGFSTDVNISFASHCNSSQIYGIADSTGLQRFAFRYNTGLQSYDTLDIIARLTDTINGGSSDGTVYPFVKVPRRELNLISMSAFIDEDKHINMTRFQNHSSESANMDTVRINNLEFGEIRPFFSSFSTPIYVQFIGMNLGKRLIPSFEYGKEKILNTTGVRDRSTSQTKIYPNPANVVVHFSNLENGASVRVYDLRGILVKHQSNIQSSLDVSDLARGIYLFELDDKGGITRYKVRIGQ